MSDNADDMNDLVLLAMARDEAVSKVKELEAKLAEQIEWVKRLADDLIAAEGREARLKEKLSESETLLAKAEGLLVDAMVQLENGKIKTRRNRAYLIGKFLAELMGDEDDE